MVPSLVLNEFSISTGFPPMGWENGGCSTKSSPHRQTGSFFFGLSSSDWLVGSILPVMLH